MSDSTASADRGSIAITGDAHAPVINAPNALLLNLTLEQSITKTLPSHLGRLIVAISEDSLSAYDKGSRRTLPPEISDKISHNHLPEDHFVIRDYRLYALMLEKAYQAVERRNADARRLVRRRAGLAYGAVLEEIGITGGTRGPSRLDSIRASASEILLKVIDRLLGDYAKLTDANVEQEVAHLAVTLVVADAVFECEVLEKVQNVATP